MQQKVKEIKEEIPAIPDFPVKLRLKPKSKQTKKLITDAKKNALIQINTKSTKPLSVIFEYLATK